MTKHLLNKQVTTRLFLLVILSSLAFSKIGASHDTVSRWELCASLGAVDFISPQRSASTITQPHVGGALDLFAVQQALSFLGLGLRGEFMFIPSKESDADATFGARAMLVVRFTASVHQLKFHVAPEFGYSFLGRHVDFDNTDFVAYQGATAGVAVGLFTPIAESFSLGGTFRVNHILASLACTDDECHIPSKGQSPGPSLFLGISGIYGI